MLQQSNINPKKRLEYTSIRGTIGHYILTSLLARQTHQPLPEFEATIQQINMYLQKSGFFDQSCWWTPLQQDLYRITYMVGKLLSENHIIPVRNGLEFMIKNIRDLYAGTCDIFGFYKNRLSILDIKTAWLKKEFEEFNQKRVAQYEAQTSAYREAIIEMTNEQIIPKDMYIISICPDKQFPDKRRIINPQLKYHIYRCKDRFDEFLDCRKIFKNIRNF